MRSPREVIEGTDWDSLPHAYAAHSADAPGHLLALLGRDPDRCAAALAYLDSALVHQGSTYPATAPATEFVAGILGDPRTEVRCGGARPLRAALLDWLGARHEVVLTFLDDPDGEIRRASIGATARLLATPEHAHRRAATAERLMRGAARRTPPERATIALTVGNWGIPPLAMLTDDHPAVRACAAMTPALDEHPAALAEIRTALRDPRAADAWFTFDRPPQLAGHVRFFLLAALLRRTTTFGEIVDEAVAIARMTSAYTVDFDWGPLLERASRHPARRGFLRALVDNDDCWGDAGNPLIWWARAGLPSDRDELRALVS